MTNKQIAADYCTRATSCLESNDLAAALDNFQKALEQDNKFYDAKVGCGFVYFEMANIPANINDKEALLKKSMNQLEEADQLEPLQQKGLICLKDIYSSFKMAEKVRGINERIHE